MRSSRRALAPLVLVAFLAGCGREATPPAEPRPAPEGPPPGIVLICIDTLRADAVRPERMPALAAFAERSTAFPDATSPASWTAPAVASLLTGLGPEGHGVSLLGEQSLPQSLTTLAEVFRAGGWSTAALTGGGWVSAGAGFRQGFDHFLPTFDEMTPEEAVRSWDAVRPRERPFFLFLHTYAAHDPYGDKRPGLLDRDPRGGAAIEAEVAGVLAGAGEDAREPLGPDALRRAAHAARLDPPWHYAFLRATPEPLRHPIAMQVGAWSESGWRAERDADALAAGMRAAYEGGLAWADAVFARTVAALKSARLPEGTVIVVVGDHGEAFGEHGVLGHGTTLYDEVVRVPLLVLAPGRAPAGAFPGSCSLADVAPTLLGWARLPVPGGLDGRSLLPLVRGEDPGWPVVGRADRAEMRPGGEVAARRGSVRTREAKYVVTWDLRTREVLDEVLYDLRADPGETAPVSPHGLGRFGERFCAAVARLRAGLVFAAAPDPLCGAALR